MGSRVEGKRKRKSKKVAVTSKFNGKRKLSRMGKKVKKGKMGPNTDFKTRSYVLKKLQISLKDFRRLCILKGIYPRVPSKAPIKGADKIYYDIKDITYLSHEPLLAKFREFKTFMKKIRKAAGRNQISEARRKDRLKPVMQLDHLVKERYPRFIDALRDMDDALCMIHLFASLPSSGRITAERTSTCAGLARQWQYYVAKSKTLRKVFVSVKGVYYQAEVMGEAITWLAPHQFTQTVPREVDLRVMMTFLEFYEVFLKFALYKLYNMVGLKYPPTLDQTLNDAGCGLLAVKVAPNADVAPVSEASLATSVALLDQTANDSQPVPATGKKSASAAEIASLKAKLSSMQAEDRTDEDEEADDDDDEEDNVPIAGPLADAFKLMQGDDDDAFGEDAEERRTFASMNEEGEHDSSKNTKRSKLFHGLKFFVNREVPLSLMQLCVLSFGGNIGWDGALSPFAVSDEGITHQIVDRPLQGNTSLSREYVQPQWVLDCINADMLLPVASYKPGNTLPPHLSPFVDDAKEGYVPQYKQLLDNLRAANGGAVGGTKAAAKEELDSDDEAADQDSDAEYEEQVRRGKKDKKSKAASSDDESEGDDSEGSDNDEDEEVEEEEIVKPTKSGAKKGPKSVMYAPKQEKMSSVSVYFKCCSSFLLFVQYPFIKGVNTRVVGVLKSTSTHENQLLTCDGISTVFMYRAFFCGVSGLSLCSASNEKDTSSIVFAVLVSICECHSLMGLCV
jgi:pescadillo protein